MMPNHISLKQLLLSMLLEKHMLNRRSYLLMQTYTKKDTLAKLNMRRS